MTVPLPEPVAGDTVSQLAFDEADHAHPVGEVTVKVPLPAVAETEAVVADRANVHVTPCCVTVSVLLPTVTFALRDDADVFAV